jgi:hypothetical protein
MRGTLFNIYNFPGLDIFDRAAHRRHQGFEVFNIICYCHKHNDRKLDSFNILLEFQVLIGGKKNIEIPRCQA